MKSILITGCSSGIGHYCATKLPERGWRVFATVRQEADLEALRQYEGVEALRLDVTEPDAVIEVVDRVLATTGGRLDAVFNNAGYGQPGAVEDVPIAAVREQFETNLFGAHTVMRATLPAMRRQGFGRLINHSSVLGFAAMPYRGAYNASKFALEGLTDTLRQELAGSGVHAILMQTGPISTRFRETAAAKFRQWIDPEASAHREVYAALAKRFAGGSPAPFTLGPEGVYHKLVKALEARRPKARYHVTVPTHVFKALDRVLPTWAMDALLLKSTAGERQ